MLPKVKNRRRGEMEVAKSNIFILDNMIIFEYM